MWEPPSATEISQSLRAAIRAELPAADPWIFPSNLYVVTKVLAQALRALYLRLAWLRRQAHVSTAEAEALEMHGADIGISRLDETYAAGLLTVAATIGTTIPIGTRFLRGDGAVFAATAAVTATAASMTVPVRADVAGKAGNTEPAAPISLETPIDGVDSVEVGAAGLTGGADRENDVSLRSRILDRRRNPPHGGSLAEYVGWARRLPGVTRVYVQRATPAPGSVTVLFMMDDTYAGGVPLAGDVTAMAALLDQLAPQSAAIVVTAPTPVTVDVTIADLDPATEAIEGAVTAELAAMFRRRAEPGTEATDFVFSRSWIGEAVSMATGENRHRLVDPADDIVCGENEVAVLGTVTFV